MLRSLASRVVPTAAKRAVDRRRVRQFMDTIGPATEEYVSSYGLEVRHGPFAGMSYLPGLERSTGDLVTKLLGSYEEQLHPAISELIELAPALLIDVGCAEGYYAVGFARALPDTEIQAFDSDPSVRAQCAELAARNGVSERVILSGECTPAELRRFDAESCALFCDCEGYEKILLDPVAVPALRHWWILVELHDWIDPSTSTTIRERFEPTHTVVRIPETPRDPDAASELAGVERSTRVTLLSERRPGAMEWALLRPRSAPPAS
jgi:hypothetical protein